MLISAQVLFMLIMPFYAFQRTYSLLCLSGFLIFSVLCMLYLMLISVENNWNRFISKWPFFECGLSGCSFFLPKQNGHLLDLSVSCMLVPNLEQTLFWKGDSLIWNFQVSLPVTVWGVPILNLVVHVTDMSPTCHRHMTKLSKLAMSWLQHHFLPGRSRAFLCREMATFHSYAKVLNYLQ